MRKLIAAACFGILGFVFGENVEHPHLICPERGVWSADLTDEAGNPAKWVDGCVIETLGNTQTQSVADPVPAPYRIEINSGSVSFRNAVDLGAGGLVVRNSGYALLYSIYESQADNYILHLTAPQTWTRTGSGRGNILLQRESTADGPLWPLVVKADEDANLTIAGSNAVVVSSPDCDFSKADVRVEAPASLRLIREPSGGGRLNARRLVLSGAGVRMQFGADFQSTFSASQGAHSHSVTTLDPATLAREVCFEGGASVSTENSVWTLPSVRVLNGTSTIYGRLALGTAESVIEVAEGAALKFDSAPVDDDGVRGGFTVAGGGTVELPVDPVSGSVGGPVCVAEGATLRLTGEGTLRAVLKGSGTVEVHALAWGRIRLADLSLFTGTLRVTRGVLALGTEPAGVSVVEAGGRVAYPGDAPDASGVGAYPIRWFYCSKNYQREGTDISNLVARAAAAGYNGVIMSYGATTLYEQPAYLQQRMVAIKRYCDEMGVELVPSVGNISGGTASSGDPSHFEAFPVTADYVASGGKATIVLEQPDFGNTSFEELKYYQGRVSGFVGWNPDEFGTTSSLGTDVVHSGSYSVKIDCAASGKDRGRVNRTVSLLPNHHYRFSVWFHNVDCTATFQLAIYRKNGREMEHTKPSLPAGEWKRCIVDFFTYDTTEITLWAGAWGTAGKGSFYIDDATLTDLGVREVIRRDGCDVVVSNAVTGVVYEEGRDYAGVAEMSTLGPFADDLPHLELTIPEGSAIRDGDRLVLSAYGPTPYANSTQRASCMCCDSWYEDYFAKCVAGVQEILRPRHWLLYIDELRSAGTCGTCRRSGLPLGQILSRCANRMYSIIRRANPTADVQTWNDMFDPHANAITDPYYICAGSFTNSWEGLPRDLTIVNWIGPAKARASLDFFSGLGHLSYAGAYYDAPDMVSSGEWLREINATPGALGMMYTTWKPTYDLLEDFATLMETNSCPRPRVSTWVGGEGDWGDAAKWDVPPAARSKVVIPAGALVRAGDGDLATIDSLWPEEGLTLDGTLSLSSAEPPSVALAGSGVLRKTGDSTWRLGTTLSGFSGTVETLAGQVYYAGEPGPDDIVLDGPTEFFAAAGTVTNVGRRITGTGPAIILGGGTVVFSNPKNDYRGGTVVSNAMLKLTANGAAGIDAVTNAHANAILRFEGDCHLFANDFVCTVDMNGSRGYGACSIQYPLGHDMRFTGDIRFIGGIGAVQPERVDTNTGFGPNADICGEVFCRKGSNRQDLYWWTYGTNRFFNRITASVLYCGYNASELGWFEVFSSSNDVATLWMRTGKMTLFAKDAFPGAVVQFRYATGGEKRGRIDLNGNDQVFSYAFDRDCGDNVGSVLNREQFYTERPATVRFTGTGSPSTYASSNNFTFDGALTVLLDAAAYPNYGMNLANRVSTTTGDLIVSNGTLRLLGGAYFPNVGAICVGPNGAIVTESGVVGTFAGCTRLKVEGRMTIAAGDADPFSQNALDVELGEDAELTLPPDFTVRVRSLTVAGVSMPIDTYGPDKVPQLKSGAIQVAPLMPDTEATWTGLGGDDTSVGTAANWSTAPDLPALGTSSLLATFASGGTLATADRELALRGIVLDAPQGSSGFTLAGAGRPVSVMRAGVTLADTDDSPAHAYRIEPQVSYFEAEDNEYAIPANAVLDFAGGIVQNAAAKNVKTGAGALGLGGESYVAGSFDFLGGSAALSGTSRIVGAVYGENVALTLSGDLNSLGAGVPDARKNYALSRTASYGLMVNAKKSADGTNANAQVCLAGATIDMPFLIAGPGSGCGYPGRTNWLYVAEHTTNVLNGQFYMSAPLGYLPLYDGSRLVISNEVFVGGELFFAGYGETPPEVVFAKPDRCMNGSSGSGPLASGNTILRFQGTNNYLYASSGGNHYYYTFNLNNDVQVFLETDECFNPGMLVFNDRTKGWFGGTHQTLRKVTAYASSHLSGESGSELVLQQGGFFSGKIEGGLSIRMLGAAPDSKEADYVCTIGTAAASSGGITVDGGRMVFSAAGSWTNAPTVTVNGGRLELANNAAFGRTAKVVMTGGRIMLDYAGTDRPLKVGELWIGPDAAHLVRMPAGVYSASEAPSGAGIDPSQYFEGEGRMRVRGGLLILAR